MRGGLAGAGQQGKIVADRFAPSHGLLAKYGRADAVILLVAEVPVIPLAELTERWHAEFEFTRQSELGLQRIVDLGDLRFAASANPHAALQEDTSVHLYAAKFALHKRVESELDSFATISWHLQFDKQAQVNGVLAGFRQ